MNKKIITFGEIMIRLSTPGFKRFSQCDSFNVIYGGGEANVAISQGTADICLEAIQTANKLGLTVSCDLNYRKKLWEYGKNLRK
jgi:2-dehydro-3-deoxygluconokinase